MLEVERLLTEKGIKYRLIELTGRAMTVADVARYSKGDINVEEICKTVIMRDEEGGRFAFFLVGKDRVDVIKARRLTCKNLRIANPAEVRDSANVDPGAVCPLTLRIPLIVNTHITALKHVNFGSGHHLYGIEIKTCDLLRIFPYTIADIAE
jgi:prolyl-tRNA editing enzyme YbaK/EbsC (Cys-tRNA(Pro) deacylase)